MKQLTASEVQFFLVISAIVAFGFGDGITAVMLMHFNGYVAEYSAVLRYFAVKNGLIAMFFFKVITATILISIPLFAQKKDGSETWKINGFLLAFTLGGAAATIGNLGVIITGRVFVQPETVIISFILLLAVLVELGDILDQRVMKLRSTTRALLTEEEWIEVVYS